MRAAVAALSIALAGCQSLGVDFSPARGYAEGFNGAVAADEPRAVLIAREILATEGNATDAMVAAYFTLAATLPTAASLGAGGACLIWDKTRKAIDAVDFSHAGAGRNAAVPVPMAPRGMLALHAKYGLKPWSHVLGPAEGVARLGFPASRALARALADAPGIFDDPEIRAIFGGKNGNPVAEGETVRQIALAGTLSQLRRSPAQFYRGPFADRMIADYRRAGVALTRAELDAAVPRFVAPVRVRHGNQEAFFAPTPGGLVTAQLWGMLFAEGAWDRADEQTRPHMLAEASKRAYADAGRWFRAPGGVTGDADALVAEQRVEALWNNYRAAAATPVRVADGGPPVAEPAGQGSTTIVTADAFGQSVACTFTMNGVLGSGRVAPETGIVVAAAPDPAGRGLAPTAMMGLRIATQDQIRFMGAGAGSPAVPVALAAAAAAVIEDGKNAEQAIALPRLYNAANPDRVAAEQGFTDAEMAALRRRGHRVETVAAMGRINLFVCPAGFNGPKSRCAVRTDRRGFGLAQQN